MKLTLCLVVLGSLLTSTLVNSQAVELCGVRKSQGLGGKTCLGKESGTNSPIYDALNYCLEIKGFTVNLDSVKTRDTTKQMVAGVLYSSTITYDNDEGVEQSCDVQVWERAWLGSKLCSVDCNGQAVGQQIDISHMKLKLDSSEDDTKLIAASPSGGVVSAQLLEEDTPKSIIKRSVDLVERRDEEAALTMGKDAVDADVKAIFNQFIVKYNRTYREYDNDFTYQEKLQVFAKNLDIVQQLNKLEKGSAIYGITKFMDYSADEYQKYLAPGFTDSVTTIPQAQLSELNLNDIPDNVDWREKGAVTDVKNQGMCGSCWAFSTTGNVEGQYAIKHGKLLSLSEQELVDCDTLDAGCNGGLPSNAYKSIETLGGLEAETDYPYDGKDETCNLDKSDVKVTVSGGVQLPEDEGLLAAWVAQNGPVSIGINANLMQFYWGGVSHPWKIFCNPKKLDHGVLIVGYGTDEKKGEPYWLIKNSWGPDWGEDGYYRIYRGDGSCGVNLMATSAVVD